MDSNEDFAQLNALRASVYRMLGSLYFTELTAEQIESFSQFDFAAFQELGGDFAHGAREMERALRHVNSRTREDFAVDYAHTFLAAGSAKDERRAVPFESVYTSETGMLMGPARHDAYKAMLKEGVLPDEALRVPEDHLSFECEFMAHLADKSVAALQVGDREEALRCVEAQQTFRRDHLANWIGEFTRAVDAFCRTRFYRGVALLTRGFVQIDEELLEECAALAQKGEGTAA